MQNRLIDPNIVLSRCRRRGVRVLWLTVLLGVAFSALIFCSWHELAKVVASGHEWEKDQKN